MTSVYLPEDLLAQLDRLASDRGISRNRLIVESCREMLERHRGDWPPGYLDGTHLSDRDRQELADGAETFLEAILSARVNRAEAPF